jgi:hypothetical protein
MGPAAVVTAVVVMCKLRVGWANLEGVVTPRLPPPRLAWVLSADEVRVFGWQADS